jgi:hypothetical protein
MRITTHPSLFSPVLRAALSSDEGGGAGGGAGDQGGQQQGGGEGQQGQQGGGAQGGAEGGQGGGDAPWYTKLPADLAADRNINRYESLDAFAKAHQNALKRFGSKDPERMLEVPEKPRGEDPEAWKAFHKALGAPDTIEGYGIKLHDKATDADRAAFDRLATAMLEQGATKEQFAPIAQVFGELLDEAEAHRTEASNERIEASKAEISKLFGDKEAVYKKEIGGLIVETFAGDEDPGASIKALDDARWGESVPFMRVLAHAMDRMAEPGSLPGNGRGETDNRVLTPYQAQGQLAAKMADTEWKKALLDPSHARHKAVVKERDDLNKQAHPTRG